MAQSGAFRSYDGYARQLTNIFTAEEPEELTTPIVNLMHDINSNYLRNTGASVKMPEIYAGLRNYMKDGRFTTGNADVDVRLKGDQETIMRSFVDSITDKLGEGGSEYL